MKPEYLRPVLDDLIEMGMNLARHVVALAATARPAEAASAVERASTAYVRAARAVRCCIMLAQCLAESPGRKPGPHEGGLARTWLIRCVCESIDRHVHESEDGALQDALEDWLDGLTDEDALDDVTLAEVIAVICRDLGLAMPPGTGAWRRDTPWHIVALCAHAARPWGTTGQV